MATYFILLFLIVITAMNTSTCIVQLQENGRVRYNQKGKWMIGLCLFYLAFVSAFRYHVGTDYGNYMASYPNYIGHWLYYIQTFSEPGIAVLAKLGSLIYNKYITLFVICAVLTVTLYGITISKYSKHFLYAILLYVFIGAWHGSFNGIRQYIAAAILFAGHRYIYDRKFWKYLLVILLAMCFHRTALIMLPVYFLAGRKITISNVITTMMLTVAMRYGYDFLFSIMAFLKGSNQSGYAYMQQEVTILRILVAWAPVLIILLTGVLLNAFENDQGDEQFYFMLVIINAALMTATANSAYLARVGIYTEMYLAMAMPRMLKFFTYHSQRVFILITLALYFIYWFYELYARGILNFTWYF